MDVNDSQDSCQMTKLQTNHSTDNTSIATVTTAEVSSAETTESPRQQPRAITMASQSSAVSYSTVHVQQSPGVSLLLTKAASEPVTHNPRKTLVRSQALRSTPSPPPENEELEGSTPLAVTSASFEYAYQSNDIEIMTPPRQDSMGHKQGSFSRDNSFEYTDSTGTDLHEFIVKTLKNPRDRKFVLKLEHDFLNFIQDPLIIFIKYPPMTSYYRMIVHRVAAFFGMEHNVDQQTGKSVIINKSINTRIPEQRFADLVSLSREDSEDSEGSMPKSILRRDNIPLSDSTPPKIDSPLLASLGMDDKRQKSFEEREEEYRKAKERIFNQSSQSSQSSLSSKGDGDLTQPQILTREERELLSQEQQPQETVPRILLKSQSFDERTMDKGSMSRSGIRIMSNRVLNRSSSSPGGSAAAFAAGERFSKTTGSPKGTRVPLAGYSVPVSGMQYWTPEGIPMVPVPGNEVPMVQTHAGMQGMVPVMGSNAPQQGNVVWQVPSESLQQSMMLINPSTGTPALGPDGNPIIVQPSYQPMVMKPGSSTGYTQHTQQHRPQQQSTTQVGQTPPVAPGQMVVPPYMGMQHPMYVVQQPGRSHFGQQGSENLSQVHWSGNTQQMTSYQDLGNQFGSMSISGQPSQEMDQSLQHGMMGTESASSVSSTNSSPMYASSMSHSSAQPGQVQYVMLPPQTIQPHQGIRPMVGPPHMVPQSMQQNPQQNPAYVVTPQTPFSPSAFQPQYGFSKDASMVQAQRSQSPPTPPRTSSPTSYNQQSGQNTQYQQQPSTAPTQSPVLRTMVPLVVAGNTQVPVGVIQGNQPSQIQSQGSTIPPFHVMPVPNQFHQPGQNRAYNMDRRQQKSSEMYEPGMVVGQPGMNQVAFGPYGEQIAMIPQGDRYAQYYQQPQRFGQPQSASGSAHHQYSKHKSKQYHKKKDSPREQSLKKQTSKSSDTDVTGGSGNVLEIYDFPSGIKEQDVDELFEDLKSAGAQVKWQDNTHDTLRAVFSCAADADQALAVINNPQYKLRFPVEANSSVQSNP